jgi:Cd2+/Zn2+-exporting ATPase
VFFALGLKAAVMLLAVAGIASLWMAIAADMGASLIVVFWSLRLLRE